MNNIDKLAVIVLGNRNSGKSMTWNTLFGSTVRTGKNARILVINDLSIEVFLVSGSSEERRIYVGDIIVDINIRIILCSMQYTNSCISTIKFFHDNGYQFYVHWLNPGYSDEVEYQDTENIIKSLQGYSAIIKKCNGKNDPHLHVNVMKNYIHDWADTHFMS